MADDVVVIADGRVRAAGTLEEIAAGYASLEEAFFSLTGGGSGRAPGGRAPFGGRSGRPGHADRGGRGEGGRA